MRFIQLNEEDLFQREPLGYLVFLREGYEHTIFYSKYEADCCAADNYSKVYPLYAGDLIKGVIALDKETEDLVGQLYQMASRIESYHLGKYGRGATGLVGPTGDSTEPWDENKARLQSVHRMLSEVLREIQR